MSFCVPTYAEEEQRNIYAEIESPSALTYFVHISKKKPSLVYFNSFVKYADEQGNEDYWIRVSTMRKSRFMYYMELEIDGVKYKLPEIQNPTYSQKCSSAFAERITHSEFYSIYSVPKDIIEKIKIINNPINMIIHKQTRQNFILYTDIGFTKAMQKIISLNYSNKDEYWQPSN